MPQKDRFDLPVTGAAAAAVEDYVAAVDLLLAAWPGVEPRLDRAVAADPDFALAHIAAGPAVAAAGAHGGSEGGGRGARAQRSRDAAREQRHIEIIALSIDGAASEALALLRAHVAEFPRDALPLSLALGVFGLFGFSGRRDHHEAQLALLEELRPRWDCRIGGFSAICGWACIETGDVAQRDAAGRALCCR